MNIKLILYFVDAFIIFYMMDGINFNILFKKNRVVEAQIFYIVIGLSLTYILTNFVYDFINISRIVK